LNDVDNLRKDNEIWRKSEDEINDITKQLITKRLGEVE